MKAWWLVFVIVLAQAEPTPPAPLVLNPVGICEGTADHVVCRPLTPLPTPSP